MRVYVLVLEGVFDLGLSAVLDTLDTANFLWLRDGKRRSKPFDVHMVGVRKRVRSQHGLQVPVVSAENAPKPDFVLIPAAGSQSIQTVGHVLERSDLKDARILIRKWATGMTRIGTACAGTFILASTSLLDGHQVTTTWWLAQAFRERFPEVILDETRMLVVSGNFVTAGAALAHLDLALWLVRQQSPELAERVARYMMYDQRPSVGAYAIPDHMEHTDPLVGSFERYVRQALARPFVLADAARALSTSERTLIRRVKHVLGKSPVAYVQDVRVDQAIHRLRTSDDTIHEIASCVGYKDGVTLTNLLRRKTGCGLRELRRG